MRSFFLLRLIFINYVLLCFRREPSRALSLVRGRERACVHHVWGMYFCNTVKLMLNICPRNDTACVASASGVIGFVMSCMSWRELARDICVYMCTYIHIHLYVYIEARTRACDMPF
jgi:hypothetical protein